MHLDGWATMRAHRIDVKQTVKSETDSEGKPKVRTWKLIGAFIDTRQRLLQAGVTGVFRGR